MGKEEKSMPTVDLSIPELSAGESMKITNLGGENYVLSELDTANKNESEGFASNYIEQATYDFKKQKHIYNASIEKEHGSYITTQQQLTNLAKNTQRDINKILKINGIVRYYMNEDDLIGRVIETIENNINTNYSIDYPKIALKPKSKKEKKMCEEIANLINEFNSQIDVKQLIIDTVIKTYSEGNYVFYLMGNKENGYGIVNYPLDMIEVTEIKEDGENFVAFKVAELKSRLEKIRQKYVNLKYSNNTLDIQKNTEKEIKNNYPPEVYGAYLEKDKLTFLDIKRTGLVRINNLGGLYGLTPIFKALKSQLILEVIDRSDEKVLIQKTKKIYYQKTRKELMGQDYGRLKPVNEIGYSHASLVQAMGQETILYTSMPYVEGLEILEPKIDLTNPSTTIMYRNRVLSALGISFVSGDSKSSITTVNVNYSELLKTVNKISQQLVNIINKFYKMILIDNGYLVEYAPAISIETTDLLDLDSKLKLIETLYSKIGISYNTILSMLGFNPETEIEKRKQENKVEVDGEIMTMDDIMSPHITSFTTSGKEGDTNTHNNTDNDADSNKNKNGSDKSQNVDKNEYDQQRQESIK